MNALVTGGTGFIGAHLMDGLLDRGHAVRVLDDLFPGSPGDVASEAEVTIGSVVDEDAIRAAVDDIEVHAEPRLHVHRRRRGRDTCRRGRAGGLRARVQRRWWRPPLAARA